MSTVTIGITTGIIGSVILSSILSPFWYKVLIPFIENLIYKDIKIEKRKWKVSANINGKESQGTMTLKRNGHKIKGEVIQNSSNEKYIIEGTFRNLVLTATYDHKEDTKIARGSLTLMAKNNGSILKGYLSFYSWENNEICSGEYICSKD
ncbi:MAG: hypothetical protein ACQESP_12415 [Candidatus Muiribacteriota bacterium]